MSNLLAFGNPEMVHSSYNLSGTGVYDGHGGHGLEHKRMMEEIANEIVDKKLQALLPEIQKDAYIQAYTKLIEKLSFDVDTVVSIALSNGEEIFHDKKTQHAIAKYVLGEITKELKGTPFSIGF